MKFYLIVLVLLFQSTFFAQESQKAKDPKMLGEFVFKSIQEERYGIFLDLIFTEEDVFKMMKMAKVSKSEKETTTKQMQDVAKNIRNGSKKNFYNIISSGKQKGIIWKEVKLIEVSYSIRKKENIQMADVFLICSFNDISFNIKLDNCFKSHIWLMLDQIYLNFD